MKATIMVNGMHCGSCEMLIRDALLETEGVKKAEPSQAKGSVSVEYDENKIDLPRIKKIIKEQGYEAN
jgi:copper chaperone CopZ